MSRGGKEGREREGRGRKGKGQEGKGRREEQSRVRIGTASVSDWIMIWMIIRAPLVTSGPS